AWVQTWRSEIARRVGRHRQERIVDVSAILASFDAVPVVILHQNHEYGFNAVDIWWIGNRQARRNVSLSSIDRAFFNPQSSDAIGCRACRRANRDRHAVFGPYPEKDPIHPLQNM